MNYTILIKLLIILTIYLNIIDINKLKLLLCQDYLYFKYLIK